MNISLFRYISLILFILVFHSLAQGQGADAFVTLWKTDNLSTGSSDKSSITIPTVSSHTYKYDVDWDGDGLYEQTEVTGSVTHTYPNPGIYQVAIKGQFPRIYFNNIGDKLKIIEILQWGDIKWENLNSAFDGCANLSESATDAPDLSIVESLSEMFRRATNFQGDLSNWDVSEVPYMISMFQNASRFNGDISSWDISSVNSIRYMFDGASSFNQDISKWDLSNVTTLEYTFRNATSFDQNLASWDIDQVTNVTGMLDNCGIKRLNYDLTLHGWAQQDVQSGLSLGATSLEYCNGIYARDSLTNAPANWTITGDSENCNDALFITTWTTNNPGPSNTSSITLPVFNLNGQTKYDVDWNNDGIFDDQGITERITHDYGTSGTFQIAIRGHLDWRFSNTRDKDKIISVDHWGEVIRESFSRSFYGCSNLNINATDSPNFKAMGITNLTNMFGFCRSLNTDLNHWDVSGIELMEELFRDCSIFDGDISDWKVDSVTNMKQVFYNADSFRQDLSGWNVSKVTNMEELFRSANSFNSDLNGWDVSSVTNMLGLFRSADSYNSDMDQWDVCNVTEMSYMFAYNSNYNGNIDNWEVGKVENMEFMFEQADAFNRDITGWNVAMVSNMYRMFQNADVFNQDISGWLTGNVMNMSQMLAGTRVFDHSLGNLDMSGATDVSDMLDRCGMKPHTYESTLMGWTGQNLNSGLTLGAQDLVYCSGATYRDILIAAPYNWAIEDDILDCANVPPCITTTENIWSSSFQRDWDEDFSWSLNVLPKRCNEVIVTSNTTSFSELVVPHDIRPVAHCHILQVDNGAKFTIEQGGILEVGGSN